MFDFLEDYGIEMTGALAITIVLAVIGEIGLWYLFGYWTEKGYSASLMTRIGSHVLMPVVTFFIIQWQASKE